MRMWKHSQTVGKPGIFPEGRFVQQTLQHTHEISQQYKMRGGDCKWKAEKSQWFSC